MLSGPFGRDGSAQGTAWIADMDDMRLLDLAAGDMWGPLASVGPILGDGEAGTFVESDGKAPWTIQDGTPQNRLDDWDRAEPLASATPPVAVLTSRRTASAAEALTIAFRGRRGTRSFGEATAGRPIANVPHPLADGAVIVLTQAWEADRIWEIAQ